MFYTSNEVWTFRSVVPHCKQFRPSGLQSSTFVSLICKSYKA